MIFKDYYKILSLETNRVSSEQLKNAYRTAAKKYHPDVNIKDRLSEEKIKDINEAYKVLSNSSTKRKYDRIWNNNVGKKKRQEALNRSSGSVITDFSNIFFGNLDPLIEKEQTKKSEYPIRGENIETSVELEIEEVFYGLEKKISLRTVDGNMKIFSVKIPPGIRDGEKIRILGQGKEGKNGGKNGDLFIKIKIKDNKQFKLKGTDLYTNLYLTPWEAALGTNTSLNLIDEKTEIKILEGTQTGEIIKIEGKGYKDGKGGRGDLIAEVKVMVPKKLSAKERKLFEDLNKVSKFNPRGDVLT